MDRRCGGAQPQHMILVASRESKAGRPRKFEHAAAGVRHSRGPFRLEILNARKLNFELRKRQG
jgi:hypothetical protein